MEPWAGERGRGGAASLWFARRTHFYAPRKAQFWGGLLVLLGCQSWPPTLQSRSEYHPGTHSIQSSSASLPSVGKYVPAKHGMHTSSEVWAVPPEYVP